MIYIQTDEQHIITNVIEADNALAKDWGLFPFYEGAEIGAVYLPYLAERIAQRIANSKVALADYLSGNPLTWLDGKRYTVTEEKQTLLMSNIASYQLEIQINPAAELTWNAAGEVCTPWTFENLCALAIAITQYVKPLVACQQKTEVAMQAAQTLEALEAIPVDYAGGVQ